MPGTASGRRCSACDREVLDLSAMHAEAAIDAVFARKGKACVRYRVDAQGHVRFAPRPTRGAAAAALGVVACAGWVEEPPPAAPGELGMCVPGAEDAGACARDGEAPAQERQDAVVEDRQGSDGRDHAGPVAGPVEAAGEAVGGIRSGDGEASGETEVGVDLYGDDEEEFVLGTLVLEYQDPEQSLFDRESDAQPVVDWWTTKRAMRVKRELRREARQQRREERQQRRAARR
jgi:hypothetical protein